MQGLKIATAFSIVAAAVTASACVPVKKPFTCKVHLNSLEGAGSLDITRIDPIPRLPVRPLQVFWHPPVDAPTNDASMDASAAYKAAADSSAMDLVIGYSNATLKGFGISDGGRLQFSPGIGSNANDFQAVVSDGSDKSWRFSADPDFTSEQGDFIFSTDDPLGKAVTDAINAQKIIKVVILKDGKQIASESFDTSTTPGRDKLLAQGRPLIESLDPRFCHPE